MKVQLMRRSIREIRRYFSQRTPASQRRRDQRADLQCDEDMEPSGDGAMKTSRCFVPTTLSLAKDHLPRARRHGAEGNRHIARQREIIVRLPSDSPVRKAARQLLATFEEMQQEHQWHLDASNSIVKNTLPTVRRSVSETATKPL
jgi:hypothetical protein